MLANGSTGLLNPGPVAAAAEILCTLLALGRAHLSDGTPARVCFPMLTPTDAHRQSLRILGPRFSPIHKPQRGCTVGSCGNVSLHPGAPQPQSGCVQVSAAVPLQRAVRERKSDRRGRARWMAFRDHVPSTGRHTTLSTCNMASGHLGQPSDRGEHAQLLPRNSDRRGQLGQLPLLKLQVLPSASCGEKTGIQHEGMI